MCASFAPMRRFLYVRWSGEQVSLIRSVWLLAWFCVLTKCKLITLNFDALVCSAEDVSDRWSKSGGSPFWSLALGTPPRPREDSGRGTLKMSIHEESLLTQQKQSDNVICSEKRYSFELSSGFPKARSVLSVQEERIPPLEGSINRMYKRWHRYIYITRWGTTKLTCWSIKAAARLSRDSWVNRPFDLF